MSEFFKFVDKDKDSVTVISCKSANSLLVAIKNHKAPFPSMVYLPKKQVKQLRKELKLWLKGLPNG